MSENSSLPGNKGDAGGSGSTRIFTTEELAKHDGSVPGRPILIAYRGKVYEVGHLFMWMTGQHFWLRAGQDLTGRMSEGPHGDDMLRRARCVGRLADSKG